MEKLMPSKYDASAVTAIRYRPVSQLVRSRHFMARIDQLGHCARMEPSCEGIFTVDYTPDEPGRLTLTAVELGDSNGARLLLPSPDDNILQMIDIHNHINSPNEITTFFSYGDLCFFRNIAGLVFLPPDSGRLCLLLMQHAAPIFYNYHEFYVKAEQMFVSLTDKLRAGERDASMIFMAAAVESLAAGGARAAAVAYKFTDAGADVFSRLNSKRSGYPVFYPDEKALQQFDISAKRHKMMNIAAKRPSISIPWL